MERSVACANGLNLEATELRLGLPGTEKNEELVNSCVKSNKRPMLEKARNETKGISEAQHDEDHHDIAPPAKTQIVGWPPVRSYRRNCFQPKKIEAEGPGFYVKVSMDGAPYLRKIDLNIYKDYAGLLKALENMFKFTLGQYSEREGYKGSDYVPTYEDKDGDWMLVGDVPWDMFMSSCKRLRIMKGSEAKGLGRSA